MRKLLLLSAVVTLAHALLLWALPTNLHTLSDGPHSLMAQAQASSFVTRTIAPTLAPPPVPAPVPVTVAAPAKKVSPKPAQTPAVAASTTAAAEALLTAETTTAAPALPVEPAQESVQIAALAEPADAPSQRKPESVAPARNPAVTTGTASPSANAARLSKAVFPPAARMLYEGKGEEKGFMKYSAGGELVWAPEGAQYTAKLEITFLLARLRTWTSKGALGDTGLQPTRFGDKPRGAEKATHFQRDKGIISFSANNPDVPLQPGAQDKLSAILQLSALIAGAPSRFGAGSSISFQAADAHRAELWEFKASGTEMLELPGGTLNGLKLTKEPTVDFDQRIEVWLAPDMGYLPVRLRITETSGTFVDLLWRKTVKPE